MTTPYSEFILAREGDIDNMTIYEDNFDSITAYLGSEDAGEFFPNELDSGTVLDGWGSYFKVLKESKPMQFGMMVYCKTPTGGRIKLEFRLYNVSNGLLNLLHTFYGERQVAGQGSRIVWGNVELPLTLALGDYAICVNIDNTYTIGEWSGIIAPPPSNPSQFVGESSLGTRLKVDFNTNTIVQNIPGNFVVTRFNFVDLISNSYIIGGSGWYQIAGQELFDGSIWQVLRTFTSNAEIGAIATIEFTKTLNNPGLIKFSRQIFVAKKDGEILAKSKLTFYIDGIKKAEWIGRTPWEIIDDIYFINSGQHTFKWVFEKLDEQVAYAEIGFIKIIEFNILNCIITEYTPPTPVHTLNISDIISSFSVLQGGAYKYTKITMTLLFYEPEDNNDFISNIQKIHIFIDENGKIYGGLFNPEPKLSKIGVNSVYYTEVELICPQIAGVGS